ncbi:prepilin-type N-terminal cleavage/methylation domain-containing protein (plasmid) [Deinococcus sp. KNUC1210]|uniref:pilus assembly FimT family protein n=1 Tax=Deinococcus sp. KNUC1210 TaxID=2917691 RepID=UPI001EF03398|nr:prepilin-type N-terminal cleavage/methylation domain-containing protein [Deinococcus sp. KNUC1210]ULH14154.1 prepilin-type N-terminal cleavage/methylation domain-containing protein [Deinococcus sp. KNUC1210]
MRSQEVRAGFTLIELLGVLALLGIIFSILALNVQGLNNDAESAASILSGALIQSRTQAMSDSVAVRATLSGNALVFATNTTCTATTGWTAISTIGAPLPAGVKLSIDLPTVTTWQACYSARGELPTPPGAALRIVDSRLRQRTLTLYMAGSVQIQ